MLTLSSPNKVGRKLAQLQTSLLQALDKVKEHYNLHTLFLNWAMFYDEDKTVKGRLYERRLM